MTQALRWDWYSHNQHWLLQVLLYVYYIYIYVFILRLFNMFLLLLVYPEPSINQYESPRIREPRRHAFEQDHLKPPWVTDHNHEDQGQALRSGAGGQVWVGGSIKLNLLTSGEFLNDSKEKNRQARLFKKPEASQILVRYLLFYRKPPAVLQSNGSNGVNGLTPPDATFTSTVSTGFETLRAASGRASLSTFGAWKTKCYVEISGHKNATFGVQMSGDCEVL